MLTTKTLVRLCGWRILVSRVYKVFFMPTKKTLVRLCGWRILVSRGYKVFMPTTRTLVRMCGWRILVSRGYKVSSCRQRRLWLDCAGAKVDLRLRLEHITKLCLFKYIENCTTKNRKFSDKKTQIFFIFLLKT